MYEVIKKVDGTIYHYHGWDYHNGKPKMYWNIINGGHPFKTLKAAEKIKARIDDYCRSINPNAYNARYWQENECEIMQY